MLLFDLPRYRKVENSLEDKCTSVYGSLSDEKIRSKPVKLRLKYDRKRVPILYSVIFINVIMGGLGIYASIAYLNTVPERIALSLCYFFVTVFATMNQGLIDKRFMILDITAAAAIFMLNIYFYARTCEWGHFVFAGLLFLYFSWYAFLSGGLTVWWYAFHTNVWHLGVIALIILLPFNVKQQNLF